MLPSLLAVGVDLTLDRSLIIAYCSSVGDAHDAHQIWLSMGSPTVVQRPSGERQHPMVATLRQLRSDAAKFGAMLGLSPRSRKVLDVVVLAVPEGPVATDHDHYFN